MSVTHSKKSYMLECYFVYQINFDRARERRYSPLFQEHNLPDCKFRSNDNTFVKTRITNGLQLVKQLKLKCYHTLKLSVITQLMMFHE